MYKWFWAGVLFGQIYETHYVVSEDFLHRVDSKFVAFFAASGVSQDLFDHNCSQSLLTSFVVLKLCHLNNHNWKLVFYVS